MNPHHLRTFLAVRRHLNYTRAAEEVFLTQPAVSRQVRQLEEKLGVRLFEQIGKSLHLTDAGETLAVEAEKLLGAMERTAEGGRSHASGERGSPTRLLFEDWLLPRKGAIRKSIELTCPETCKALVRAGIGISFMSVHGLRAEIRAKYLVKIPVTEMSLKRPIYLAKHSDKRNSPVMASFLAIVEIALPKLTTPRGYGGR